MKKRTCILVACLMLFSVLSGLSGCYIPRECPKDGIWYCEALDMYLDMENNEGLYLDPNGSYAPMFFQIDYGTGFFINYCDRAEFDYDTCEVLRTDYKYKNGTLRLEDRDSGQVYEFIEVDEELYPGG
ncbi:MAG: hypothetical protein IJW45_09245 [Oscillospiraceae bacterium]|nr:hypothetical protein [Oscillospiraceae bacterium]